MRRIVSDTGPLLHLSEAQLLDLLESAGEVHIPRSVEMEIAYQYSAWSTPVWIVVDTLTGVQATEAISWQRSGILHIGEAEAIALVQHMEADWFLTDDAAARFLAQMLGFEVHGSLGIVL